MDKEELKNKILAANAAYRAGNSIISDSEYDNLVEEFEKNFPDEYDEFRDSLNESAVEHGTKVKHPFTMGSLNKVTIEKPDEIFKFIKKNITTCINVSAKVDGISCRLHYENGKLVQASTRGDGSVGTDITDKSKFIKCIPGKIDCKDMLDIRGELVILKNDFACLEGFANPRNATAGIVNRKDWTVDDVGKVSFIAYTILGRKYPKDEQFKLLKDFGFTTAWHDNYTSCFYNKPEFIDKLVELLTMEHDYETDGLVIADSTWHNEEKYRPDASVAVKGNMNSAVTKIIDVEWRGPSSNGKFVPVAQLEPVQLCGTTVSQATLNNLDFIEKMNFKYGSTVVVQKRGEIIPSLTKLISNDNTTDIEVPTECPYCSSKLVVDGPFVWCKNKDCPEQTLKQIASFIKKLDVKHASEATLKKFKIFSFDDLIAFKGNPRHKSETTLLNELSEKVFTRSRLELLAATNFKDLSEVLINKIVEFYGFDNIEAGNYIGLPDGIGEITLAKFKEDILENLDIVNKFINDPRYNCKKVVQTNSRVAMNGSVCFTGKLDTMSRTQASKLAEENGYEVYGAVKKGLTYLVTNDAGSGSSKNKKAKELGIAVIDEATFVKMMKSASVEDIDDL